MGTGGWCAGIEPCGGTVLPLAQRRAPSTPPQAWQPLISHPQPGVRQMAPICWGRRARAPGRAACARGGRARWMGHHRQHACKYLLGGGWEGDWRDGWGTQHSGPTSHWVPVGRGVDEPPPHPALSWQPRIWGLGGLEMGRAMRAMGQDPLPTDPQRCAVISAIREFLRGSWCVLDTGVGWRSVWGVWGGVLDPRSSVPCGATTPRCPNKRSAPPPQCCWHTELCRSMPTLRGQGFPGDARISSPPLVPMDSGASPAQRHSCHELLRAQHPAPNSASPRRRVGRGASPHRE